MKHTEAGRDNPDRAEPKASPQLIGVPPEELDPIATWCRTRARSWSATVRSSLVQGSSWNLNDASPMHFGHGSRAERVAGRQANQKIKTRERTHKGPPPTTGDQPAQPPSPRPTSLRPTSPRPTTHRTDTQASRCEHALVSCEQDQRPKGAQPGRRGRGSPASRTTRPNQTGTMTKTNPDSAPTSFFMSEATAQDLNIVPHLTQVKFASSEPRHMASCFTRRSFVWKNA